MNFVAQRCEFHIYPGSPRIRIFDVVCKWKIRPSVMLSSTEYYAEKCSQKLSARLIEKLIQKNEKYLKKNEENTRETQTGEIVSYGRDRNF